MDIFIFGYINNTMHFMLVLIEIDVYRKFHQMAKHYDSFLQPVSTIFKLQI